MEAGDIFQERYRILSRLGTGGMGDVYHAIQIDAKREVALKLLRQEQVNDDETIKRFYREFQNLAKMQHQHIVTIYGLALDHDNTPYAICEYIEGRTLRDFIADNGALAWQRALKIMIQICEAMEFAHRLNIIHRDLKPENVMLLQTPEPDYVKIIDFGLSRASIIQLDESQRLTSTGQMIGTPSYMSPEQFNSPADNRSDIYALGCIAFEMLSGEKLFDSDNSIGTIYRHLKEDPLPRFAAISARVPLKLLSVLQTLLLKAPQDRPQSMAQLLVTLKELQAAPGALINGRAFVSQGKGKSAKALSIAIVSLISVLILGATVANSILSANKQQVANSNSSKVPLSKQDLIHLFILGSKQLNSASPNDLAGAEAAYSEAIDRCDFNGRNGGKKAVCIVLRARCEWMQGKDQQAEADFDEAANIASKVKPDGNTLLDIFLEKARFHFHQRKFKLAIEEFNRAVNSRYPKSFGILPFTEKLNQLERYMGSGIEKVGCSRNRNFLALSTQIQTTKPNNQDETLNIILLAKSLARVLDLIANTPREQDATAIPLVEFAIKLSKSLQNHDALKAELEETLASMKSSYAERHAK
jgi:serine/threonine protein kinase